MIHPEEIIDFIINNSESLYPSLGVYEYVFNNKNAVKFLNLLKQNGLECKNIEIFEKEKMYLSTRIDGLILKSTIMNI